MAYAIIELQTDAQGSTTTTPIRTEPERNNALSVFHQIAASAAISSVVVHVVFLVDETGNTIKREVFQHEPEEE